MTRTPESTRAAKLAFRTEVAERRARRTGQPNADAPVVATTPVTEPAIEPTDYPAHWVPGRVAPVSSEPGNQEGN